MPRFMYTMRDADPKGMFHVESLGAARKANAEQQGVFWTVNAFKSPVRKIANLERVLAWAVDMDEGTKAEQASRISQSPLIPSVIVETKRGYQVYWQAKDATPESWNAVVLERLVPWFGADANARDLARVLRVPSFMHWKDPADPFECKTVHARHVEYDEAQMLAQFAPTAAPVTEVEAFDRSKREARRHGADAGSSFWESVWQLDCADALCRLSGHPLVQGEVYTFRRTSDGKRNVLVNGKGTSVWIDSNGRIGSLSKGGPTIANWLRWYGHTWRQVVDCIKAELGVAG